MIPKIREASWSAPVLWRFARRRNVCEIPTCFLCANNNMNCYRTLIMQESIAAIERRDCKKSDAAGFFAGAGSGATAPLFGCVEQTFLSAGGGTFQFRFRRLAAVAPERRFGAPRRRKSRPNPQAGKPALLFRLLPQQQRERRVKRME
jgi:hypothetical protein